MKQNCRLNAEAALTCFLVYIELLSELSPKDINIKSARGFNSGFKYFFESKVLSNKFNILGPQNIFLILKLFPMH